MQIADTLHHQWQNRLKLSTGPPRLTSPSYLSWRDAESLNQGCSKMVSNTLHGRLSPIMSWDNIPARAHMTDCVASRHGLDDSFDHVEDLY